MLDEKEILSLNFLSYEGIYTGDHHGMRYRLARTGEKPDFSLTAWVWPEPLCFEAAPEEKKTAEVFAFTEEGRRESIRWLKEQYETRIGEWETAPRI